jgi:hypothetical protein
MNFIRDIKSFTSGLFKICKDFIEFLIAISITAQGDARKKLSLAFKIYDQDKNGTVDRKGWKLQFFSFHLKKKSVDAMFHFKYRDGENYRGALRFAGTRIEG